MRVTVVFDFPDVTDINGNIADMVLTDITEDTVKWAGEYRATVWVDDVDESKQGESK